MLVLALGGCVGNSSTGTVTGKVTYGGTSVPAGCTVSFVSNEGYAAVGVVDGDGRYQLKMAGRSRIPVAKYQVAVTAPAIKGPVMTAEEERKFMAGDRATVAKFTQKKSKPLLPLKYADMNRSGLSFEVESGSNVFDIELL